MPLQHTAQHNVQASKLRAKIRGNIHLAGTSKNNMNKQQYHKKNLDQAKDTIHFYPHAYYPTFSVEIVENYFTQFIYLWQLTVLKRLK